jgi:toxin secretion/phage lysis holin
MNNSNYIIGILGGIVGSFLGGLDGFIYALVMFVSIDYVTGMFCAIKSKSLSSEIGFWGLVRKFIIFLLVGIANILDDRIFGFESVIRTAVIFFFLSNEGLSILENVSYLGVPFPEKLKDVLVQLKNNEKKN